MIRKILIWSVFALSVLVMVQGWSEAVEVKKLGSPRTSFYSPDIKTPEDLHKMLQVRREDIRTVVTEMNWSGNIQDLFNALDKGEFQETTISSGTTFPFMAARKNNRAYAIRDVHY